MTHDFVSLAIIAMVAALAPIIANLIPRKPIPETVLLLIAGALLGPSLANAIWLDESVLLISDLGCAMLFLLAGYEIDPKVITGREGKRALKTWFVTMALALAVVHLTIGSDGGMGGLAVSIALTTTAIGALMPILKERNLLGNRTGESVLAYGTWGELGPVLAMALLLSARATWMTLLILGAFLAIAVATAVFGQQSAAKTGNRIYEILSKGSETTSQTVVRVTMFLLIALVALSSIFHLDIVLGAFAAGFILRFVIPEGNHSLESKLDAIGYGFLIPVFFVISGAKIDLTAVVEQPGMLFGFIGMLLLVRAVPIVVSMATDANPEVKELGRRNHLTVALYCTTALPLIVAVTSLAVDAGAMEESLASVFVSAGALTVLLMPLLASATYRVHDAHPIEAVRELRAHPKDAGDIIKAHVRAACSDPQDDPCACECACEEARSDDGR